MSEFRSIDRDALFLLPPSMDGWLPQCHQARFLVRWLTGSTCGRWQAAIAAAARLPQHPPALVALLIYGYATGAFSSRKLKRATHNSVAFRFVVANDHPDHDTIATFRRRFLPEIERLFVEVLMLAREVAVLALGTLALDGMKIEADASKHSALSHRHAETIEAQLKGEVAALMAMAEAADVGRRAGRPVDPGRACAARGTARGDAAARPAIEARSAERHARERPNGGEDGGARGEDDEDRQEAGKGGLRRRHPRGRAAGPSENLTDADSRIIPRQGGGICRPTMRRRRWPPRAWSSSQATWSRRPTISARSSPGSPRSTRSAPSRRCSRQRLHERGTTLRLARLRRSSCSSRRAPSANTSRCRALRAGAGGSRRSDAARGDGARSTRCAARRSSRWQAASPAIAESAGLLLSRYLHDRPTGT